MHRARPLLAKGVRITLRPSAAAPLDKTIQMLDQAMISDGWRLEHRRHRYFEKRTQKAQRERGMAMSAAHYAKVNNGMKLFCWQEAIKTLEEVETILDRVGHDFPDRIKLTEPPEEEGDPPMRVPSKKYRRFRVNARPPGPAPPLHVLRGMPSYAICRNKFGDD
eukprot:TRINITY_DN9227_c0_g1_i1.p2 TRINITY_DN9227_c0_g1~~TRINITY_DN9227_c0_g1_i1.p2  ORF type:complete len:164 (-),score=56.45 TRINITY_DN9227_c0_g1_i1:73-564(-)